MTKRTGSGDDIRVNIQGGVGQGAQFIAGSGNTQTNTTTAAGASQAELEEVKKMLAQLMEDVRASSPPDKKEEAVGQVKELEDAITSPEPDIDRMSGVKSWFKRNIPKLAGSVVGVIVNPIVGKVVEAAGEGLAGEIQRRFGEK
jgi:hypothetical protein